MTILTFHQSVRDNRIYLILSMILMLLFFSIAYPFVYETYSHENEKSAIFDAIIVGGGIAGMTSAYYLKDYNIKVLEKRNQVGGKAFSTKYKEFSYACGAEYLGKLYGPLKKIVEELKLTVREIPYPMDVHFHDQEFYYGEMGKALAAHKYSSLSEFIRFGKSVQNVYNNYEDIPNFDLTSDMAELDNITAREWFNRMKFPPYFADTYNVTFKGLFGATIDEISALSSLTEIVFDFEDIDLDKELSDIDELENDATPGKYSTGAYSFDTGIADIPLAIARYLGNKVQMNATVTEVVKTGENYLVQYTDDQGNAHTIKAAVVIMAVPAPVTLKIAEQTLSAEQKNIMNQISYACFVTLALYSSKPIFNNGFDLSVPDGMFFTDIYDATWIQRYYQPALQNAGTFITTVYIAPESYKNREIIEMSDSQILAKTYQDLEKIFPGVSQKIEEHHIYRFEHAYPVMTPGAYQRLTKLHQITNDNLLLAGDYMIYPTLEAAADSGVLAAEKAIKWLKKKTGAFNGDANIDGKIDLIDIIMYLQTIAGYHNY